eukprot:scpid99779/ scgid32195/ 
MAERKSLRIIAAKVVKAKTAPTMTKAKRTGRKDIKTPARNDVTLRAAAITRGGRLTKAAFSQLQEDFPDQNLKPNFVRKQLKWYKEQEYGGVPTSAMEWGRKRKHCGREAIKFTESIAQKDLIDINNRHWGQLSFKRLAGKLAERGTKVTAMTIRKWCKDLGMVKRRRYIKPKLTATHRINRLQFALGQIDRSARRFTNLENVVHADEKWFFLMKDGQVCRVFPDKDGKYKLPASPKLYHKSRCPKVMFLAACAKPRDEYGYDGRV